MSKQSEIGKRVDETLESLEGIQRAEPAPWFLARVKAKLEREKHNIWETTGSYMARPTIAIAGLLFILGINAFILFKKDNTSEQFSGSSTTITEPVEEYVLSASNTNYDYLNMEP